MIKMSIQTSEPLFYPGAFKSCGKVGESPGKTGILPGIDLLLDFGFGRALPKMSIIRSDPLSHVMNGSTAHFLIDTEWVMNFGFFGFCWFLRILDPQVHPCEGLNNQVRETPTGYYLLIIY